MADDKKKPKEIPRGKDIKSLADAINKYVGAGIVVAGEGSEEISAQGLYKYPTGILSLDRYLGVGGLLGGRVMNTWGWEGTGKTLSALTVAAAVQRMKFEGSPLNPTGEGRVAFLDAEGTFSFTMARSIGVDVDKVLLFRSTPEKILTGEDYFSIMSILIQNGIELIIVDSVPALIPESRLTAVVGHGQKATQAQMMAEGLQQVTTLLNAFQRSVVWFINQKRMKPMVMFGPTEDSTGGAALKFFASYSLEVKKLDDIVKSVPNGRGGFEPRRIGVAIEAELHKNKTASIPMEKIRYDVYFGDYVDKDGLKYSAGVDVYKDVVETALLCGVIKQSSSWFYYGDLKGNGMEKLVEQLRAGGDALIQKIRDEVLTIK